jgi:hypothetical protein
MPGYADDLTVTALLRHDRDATACELRRRMRRVDDCVMTRARGFTGCGLRYCGGGPNRLCGEDRLTLTPTQPVRGLVAV